MTEPIRIELPTMYGMKSVNAYLFLTPELTLIDCGEKTDASWDALQTALAKHGLAIKDIKRVIITHAHVDHIGMAHKISEESGAKTRDLDDSESNSYSCRASCVSGNSGSSKSCFARKSRLDRNLSIPDSIAPAFHRA